MNTILVFKILAQITYVFSCAGLSIYLNQKAQSLEYIYSKRILEFTSFVLFIIAVIALANVLFRMMI